MITQEQTQILAELLMCTKAGFVILALIALAVSVILGRLNKILDRM